MYIPTDKELLYVDLEVEIYIALFRTAFVEDKPRLIKRYCKSIRKIQWKFKVGDRVARVKDPYKIPALWEYEYAEVIARYQYKSQQFGFYPEMYMVRFDNGKIRKGFLRHELDSVSNLPQSVANNTH